MLSTISIIGLGKLGAPIAACFAASGFQTIAVDIDAQKTDAIGRGVPPVHEPGLAELLQESQGRLLATKDTEAAIRDSEATFIVVGTPSEADGGFSLRYVIATCEAIGRALRNKDSYHLIVLTSTVMPVPRAAKLSPRSNAPAVSAAARTSACATVRNSLHSNGDPRFLLSRFSFGRRI